VKYRSLSALCSFVPVAVESLGALDFFRNLGHRITSVTTEPRSFQLLMQRLSVAVQRGNAAFVLGTFPDACAKSCFDKDPKTFWKIFLKLLTIKQQVC